MTNVLLPCVLVHELSCAANGDFTRTVLTLMSVHKRGVQWTTTPTYKSSPASRMNGLPVVQESNRKQVSEYDTHRQPERIVVLSRSFFHRHWQCNKGL